MGKEKKRNPGSKDEERTKRTKRKMMEQIKVHSRSWREVVEVVKSVIAIALFVSCGAFCVGEWGGHGA